MFTVRLDFIVYNISNRDDLKITGIGFEMIETHFHQHARQIDRGNRECEPKNYLVDFDMVGWDNLLSLTDSSIVKQLAEEASPSRTKKKRMLLVFEGSTVTQAYHSENDSRLEGLNWNGPECLEEIAHKENADVVVAIERCAMERIYNRFRQQINSGGDFIRQLIGTYDSIRLEVGSGIYFYPPRRLEPIRKDAMQKILKLVTPTNGGILFYLFDGNEIWTSLIIKIKNGALELFTSHSALATNNISINNWREDYRKIISATTGTLSKPAIGFFSDLRAFAKMSRAHKTLGALKEARKRKDIIIEPLPMRIKAMLSAGRLIGL